MCDLRIADECLSKAVELLCREDVGEYGSPELTLDLQALVAEARVRALALVTRIALSAGIDGGRRSIAPDWSASAQSSDVTDCHPTVS